MPMAVQEVLLKLISPSNWNGYDDIWQVTDGLDAIINNLKSKIITAADKELQENDGFMWLSFNQVLSHLSRVTNMYK